MNEPDLIVPEQTAQEMKAEADATETREAEVACYRVKERHTTTYMQAITQRNPQTGQVMTQHLPVVIMEREHTAGPIEDLGKGWHKFTAIVFMVTPQGGQELEIGVEGDTIEEAAGNLKGAIDEIKRQSKANEMENTIAANGRAGVAQGIADSNEPPKKKKKQHGKKRKHQH